MLCLACGTDNLTLGPECFGCGGWLGYLADNRGFLPQLEVLQEALAEGVMDAAEAHEQLARLEAALQLLLRELDDEGEAVMQLDLDDAQQGTVGGFLAPVRQGLEAMLAASRELSTLGDWPEALWNDLREAQLQVVRGHEGVQFLANVVKQQQTVNICQPG